MNIFYLDQDARLCAEAHMDTHVRKMILEYAQLMSTAHRVLDGDEVLSKTSNGRKKILRVLSDPDMNSILYSATHINHPSAKWVRDSVQNYQWLFDMWVKLLDEYVHRFGKVHKTSSLKNYLKRLPQNINDVQFVPPPPVMESNFIVSGDSIQSYRKYYMIAKNSLAVWTNRSKPIWYDGCSWVEYTRDMDGKLLSHRTFGVYAEYFFWGKCYELGYDANTKTYYAGCQEVSYDEAEEFYEKYGDQYKDSHNFIKAIREHQKTLTESK